MTEDNITYTKAYNFAIRIVKAYKYLCEEKKEYDLSKQLLRSGTVQISLKPMAEFPMPIFQAKLVLPTKNVWKQNIGCRF